MTKKDYKLIAQALYDARRPERDKSQADHRPVRAHNEIVDSIAVVIANALASENARFDFDRFLAACGSKDK